MMAKEVTNMSDKDHLRIVVHTASFHKFMMMLLRSRRQIKVLERIFIVAITDILWYTVDDSFKEVNYGSII